jgi:hypothetical protein
MRAFVIVLLIVFIPLQTAALAESENTIGVGVFVGVQIPEVAGDLAVRERYDWYYTVLQPTYGWLLSERWEIYLEGNFGWYHFDDKKEGGSEDHYTLGLSAIVAYEFLKFDKWSTFVEGGLGMVYLTGIPEEHGEPLVQKDSFPLLVQFGTGFKFNLGNEYFLKVAYRFTHISSILRTEEGGLNNHGALVAIVKAF